MKDLKEALGVLGQLAIASGIIFVVLFGLAVFNAWVFSYMWQWFITPAFGVKVPEMYVLFGLMVTTIFIFGRNHLTAKKDNVITFAKFVILKGLVIISVGWVTQAIFA